MNIHVMYLMLKLLSIVPQQYIVGILHISAQYIITYIYNNIDTNPVVKDVGREGRKRHSPDILVIFVFSIK